MYPCIDKCTLLIHLKANMLHITLMRLRHYPMKVSFAVYIQYRAPSNNQSVFKMQMAVRVLFEYHPDQYLARNQVVLTIALGVSKKEQKVICSARWAARCSSMLRVSVDSDAVTP